MLTVAFSSVVFRVAYVVGKVLKSSSSVATKLETPPTRAQTLKTKAVPNYQKLPEGVGCTSVGRDKASYPDEGMKALPSAGHS